MRAVIFKRSYTAVALALALLMCVGCSGCEDDPTSPDDGPDAVELTRDGWNAFEALDWTGALDNFERAINRGAESTEAYSGAGWANFRLGNQADARVRWNEGLQEIGGVHDINFGLASLDMLEDDFDSAIDHFLAVLETHPNYTFIHASGINNDDIRLGLAQCYFFNEEYQNSLAQVQVLNSRFEADLTTVEGLTELSQEIDRLISIYG
ncbi:tetratricopeptide repeat protein [bacterium]|nr:tetratricopeptide repeat protein [bacterium]